MRIADGKTLDLCKPCAVIRGMSQKLKQVHYGVDNKITCADCGRRRYGATYEVVAENLMGEVTGE